MNWPSVVFSAVNWIWFLLGLSCLGLAAALAVRPAAFAGLKSAVVRWERRNPWLPFAVWGIGVALFAASAKLAQYSLFQLTADSGWVINAAWNFIHGYGWWSSTHSRPFLAGHFSGLSLLLSPTLLSGSSVAYPIVYGAVCGLSAWPVYLLAKLRRMDAIWCWLAALLAFAHPSFQGLFSSWIEDSVLAPTIFLWAVYCIETRRRGFAACLLTLFLLAKEEAPFAVAGLALWRFLRAPRRSARHASLVVLPLLLWVGEMKLISHFRDPAYDIHPWSLFANVGGSPERVVETAVLRPGTLVQALLSPAALRAPAALLGFAAFLPLGGGFRAIPLLAAWLPHQLADPNTFFHSVSGYYAGFVFGPLLWAMVAGLERAVRRSGENARHLAAALLCAAGTGCLFSTGSLKPRLMPSAWSSAVPRAMAHIPADAKLWTDGNVLTHSGLRHYVKFLPASIPNPFFESGLFVPDRVLMSAYCLPLWDPSAAWAIPEYLRRNRFEVIFQDHDLIVFANPATRGRLGGPAVPAQLPRR